jgi:hypothetical protein
MKNIIDITNLLSADLKSRYAVNDLLLFINNTEGDDIVIDFANVKFATRSFIDEYYNVIMKNTSINKRITTINIPEDIQFIFNIVQKTQNKEKNIKLDAKVIKCETFSELQQRAFKTLTKIAKANQGKTIVVATHGGFIKVVQGNLLGLALERLGEIPYLPNAAILELEYIDGQFKIISEVIDSYLVGMKTEMPKGI